MSVKELLRALCIKNPTFDPNIQITGFTFTNYCWLEGRMKRNEEKTI